MVEPVMISKEMTESRETKVDALVSRCNRKIQEAAKQGLHRTIFLCDKDDLSEGPFYAEVRAKFEKAGYCIVPTGYNGGVWQLTEDIEW